MTTTPKVHEGHENLSAALAAFQSELPRIEKGKTGDAGTYKYAYADLADISPVVLPLLGKHGLAWTAQPTLVGDQFVLRYALTHEGGSEALEGMYPLPDPTTTLPQKLGSAITYARRYALCSVTGIAPGGDDDDAAAANDAPASRARRSAPRQQARPQQAAPAVPLASQDWAAEILPVRDLDALRGIHERADAAKEIGSAFGGDHKQSVLAVIQTWGLPTPNGAVTVGALIGAVKRKIEVGEMPDGETSADEEAAEREIPAEAPTETTEWPTVQPGEGGAS